MVASSFVLPTPATASAPVDQKTLTICTSLKTGYQLISKTGKCNERIYETRTWFQKGSAPSGTPGSKLIDLATCISKSSGLQIIRTRLTCNSITTTTALWQRPLGPSVAPSMTSVVMGLLGTATLNIAPPAEDGGARITSYLVTSSPAAVAATFTPVQIKAAKITGLTPGSTYSFSVVAINSKGSSPSSIASAPALAPTIPNAPGITKVVATGTNSAQLTFTAPLDNGGSPIISFVATSNPGSLQTTVHQSDGGTINITNLSHSTSYTFSLKAINAAGSSLPSAISASITTATPPPPPEPVAVAPALAAPAFTLSSSSETLTVNTAATGFTINSTGGAIASFAISATPAGMSFSTSTGALTGTPTTVASATTYTITATNASGSATQTFTLTVTAAPIVISVAAIAGVTAPVIGAFPVTTTTAGTGYTGTVSWSGSPATFAAATTYTATITLTPTSGYTLTGVSANFFSVAGATSVTHSANAGVISAVFPATAVGAAAKVAITVASFGTQRRTAFTTQPRITVQDSAGNTVTTSTALVTATISAGGTLVGTLTATATSGVATFTGLGVDGTIRTAYTITYTASGLTTATATVTLTGTTCDGTTFTCQVGDTGPGGGIVYYVSANFFTSTGSTCNTQCKYLEVAPATWQGSVVADDLRYQWSSYTDIATGQDITTVSTEGFSEYEKANWQIGKGFSNTSVMKVDGATSAPQAAVLAYAGDSTAGQWFIPSMNELNELCKYARGQTTGDLTVACVTGSGTFKSTENAGTDLGGFLEDFYWSSTEFDTYFVWFQLFNVGIQDYNDKDNTSHVRPVRAF